MLCPLPHDYIYEDKTRVVLVEEGRHEMEGNVCEARNFAQPYT